MYKNNLLKFCSIQIDTSAEVYRAGENTANGNDTSKGNKAHYVHIIARKLHSVAGGQKAGSFGSTDENVFSLSH